MYICIYPIYVYLYITIQTCIVDCLVSVSVFVFVYEHMWMSAGDYDPLDPMCWLERGWVAEAVRITWISQDLRGGHETPLRATASRWDPGKLEFGEGVRKGGPREKGDFCSRSVAHQAGGLTRLLSTADQGAETIISIKLINILRLRKAPISNPHPDFPRGHRVSASRHHSALMW